MKFKNTDTHLLSEELNALKSEISELEPMCIRDFDPEKTLLAVVDIVNGFVYEGSMHADRVQDIVSPSARLLKMCKELGVDSCVFCDCHDENSLEFLSFPPHCIKGTHESEAVDEIKSIGGYTLIEKNSTNGFHEDKFKDIISENNYTDFIVVGDCTDICVMQLCLSLKTYFINSDRQSRVIIPVNCVETYDAPNHDSDFYNLASYAMMRNSGIEFVSEIIG